MSDLILIVDEILTRYTNDEVGETQKEKYNEMTDGQKLQLLANTLNNTPSYEDFEINLVINFDYSNY